MDRRAFLGQLVEEAPRVAWSRGAALPGRPHRLPLGGPKSVSAREFEDALRRWLGVGREHHIEHRAADGRSERAALAGSGPGTGERYGDRASPASKPQEGQQPTSYRRSATAILFGTVWSPIWRAPRPRDGLSFLVNEVTSADRVLKRASPKIERVAVS